MPVVWKGGPGHKAPYRTTHVRVPEAIKSQVERMAEDYKRSVLADSPATITGDKSKYRAYPGLSFIDYSDVIRILEECLTMPANRGGAIKVKIREAIAILTGED